MLSEIQRNESIEADIRHNASIIAIKKNGAQNIHAKRQQVKWRAFNMIKAVKLSTLNTRIGTYKNLSTTCKDSIYVCANGVQSLTK